jgi:hypothetical protein
VKAADQVRKLEALLARVTARATEPRSLEPEVATTGARAASTSAAPATVREDEEIELDSAALESAPPPPMVPERPLVLEEPSESRERLVAAEPLSSDSSSQADEQADEQTDVQSLPPVRPTDEPLVAAAGELPDIEVGTADVSVEEAEEAPASSRRSIALEPPLEELAFGDAPAPPLTPPPESGRQVAVPAVDLDFEGDFTGVRPKPEEAAARHAPARPATVPPVAAAAQSGPAQSGATRSAAPPPLVPEVVRPVLPAEAHVVGLEGKSREFRPTTFGEVLEAALNL